MKKYFVSLAAKVPCNYEVEIKASSEKQALKKALEKWENKKSCESLTEPDWEHTELNISISKKLNEVGNGVCISKT